MIYEFMFILSLPRKYVCYKISSMKCHYAGSFIAIDINFSLVKVLKMIIRGFSVILTPLYIPYFSLIGTVNKGVGRLVGLYNLTG